MQEEGNQGPDRNYRQDRHHLFAGEMEKYAEDGAGHDTIARRKTVYAVHQVDGVDNANGGKTVSGTAYQEEIGPMPHKPRKSFMQ